MPTLTELQARRQRYLDAEAKILESQEYRVGQGGNHRSNRRAELDAVQAQITKLDAEIDKLQAGGSRRLYRVVPGC